MIHSITLFFLVTFSFLSLLLAYLNFAMISKIASRRVSTVQILDVIHNNKLNVSNYTPAVNQKGALVDKINRRREVIVCFCFDNELDLLHVKLSLLHNSVAQFVLVESVFSQRGLLKRLYFQEHKNETRYAPYMSKIHAIVDKKVPNATGRANGWQQTDRVKEVIGEYIEHAPFQDDTVVLVSDMDEIPSVELIEWVRKHCCSSGTTVVVDMPYHVYGLHWQASKMSGTTLTARNLRDERRFWRARSMGTKILQTITRPPSSLPTGIHCSYCTGVQQNVEKLQHTNLVDGPPMLGKYFYDENVFKMLRGCGVKPQGDNLVFKEVLNSDFRLYDYMSMDKMNLQCPYTRIKAKQFAAILPTLQIHKKLNFILE